MILTEEQRGTAAFDLEKARAVDIDLLAATDWGELRARYRAALAEIERLRAEMDNYGDDFVCQMKSKDANIRELEDALVEERAGMDHNMIRGSSCKFYDECDHGNFCGFVGCPHKTDFLGFARSQLQAEGKIGPDAKPHCWQITEERKAVILHCKRMLTFLKEDDAPCYDVEKITKDESVLVAMLEDAK